MGKRGAAQLVIFGIPIATLVWLYFSFFVIGPKLDNAFETALQDLGDNIVCPEEFATDNTKICFNAKGDVIVDGLIQETIAIKIDGASNSCIIGLGDYDFEYSGCRLDNFKQLTTYNIVMLSSKGQVSISSLVLSRKIMSGLGIMKITPKGVRLLRKLSYLSRFL